jgi:hypothetical protein
MRGLKKRGGISKLYATAAGTDPIMDMHEYLAPDGSKYILVATGTKLRAYYSAAWNDLRTSLTAGKRYSFATHQGYCYVANGTDANFKLWNTAASAVGIAPPAAAPTVAQGDAGTLSGRYVYAYCYHRSTPAVLTGNPSPISAQITVSSHKVDVTVVHSSDPQVDYIDIYRSQNLDAGGDATILYKATEVSNTDQVYHDNAADSALTTTMEYDNTVPPKAMFVLLHKDIIFYANCPDQTDGGSLVMWSKVGRGEAVPAANYQYIDRRDGNEITGIASVGDYVIVFKKNKIAVIEGDFSSYYVFSHKLGCIAPWAIIQYEDKILFLSEEGWKAFDGANLYDVSDSLRPLITSGYISSNLQAVYSAARYHVLDQFLYLCNHPSATPRVFAGQFLVPLLYINRGIPETTSYNIVGWTYHEYPNHTLTCLAEYTDANGVGRVIAGSSNGYVYQLDSGPADDTHDIPYRMETGWLPLGVSRSLSKTIRLALVSIAVDLDCTVQFMIEKDYESPFFTKSMVLAGLTTSYCGYMYCGYAYLGMLEGYQERVPVAGPPGKLFRFSLSGSDQSGLTLHGMNLMYRIEGVR